MATSINRLRHGQQLREVIMASVVANGGKIRYIEAHRAILAAGLRCHERKVSYHLGVLVEDKKLKKSGTGQFWLPDALERSGEKVLATMPFGTTLKGRILLAMQAIGINETRVLIKYLKDHRFAKSDSAVKNALSGLRREGYVKSDAYGCIMISEKALSGTGMKMRRVSETDGVRAVTALRLPIMRHLRVYGPTRAMVLIKAYGDPSLLQSQRSVYSALHSLARGGYAKPIRHGWFADTGKDFTGLASARDLGPHIDFVPMTDESSHAMTYVVLIDRHLQEHGLTDAMTLIRTYGDPADKRTRKAVYRALGILMREKVAGRVKRGRYKSLRNGHCGRNDGIAISAATL